MHAMHVRDAAERIRMEYAEMPGLRLTFWQAKRLWSLPEDLCDSALDTLTRTGYLVRTRDGHYRRPHPERSPEEPMAGMVHGSVRGR